MAVCASCGEENPDRARLCMMCGAALSPASRRRERRFVSVLFADLVGFTGRSERLDIEDVAGLLEPYHRLLRDTLERHGGLVEKFIGDAVMALFGAPRAHEDDAERAVRASLAIQDALVRLRERDGIDLHARVGVTTGEAFVALGVDPRTGQGLATGDVVNTAARLQSAAPADGALVDEATYRRTDRAFDYAAEDVVWAKGKAEPIAVWRPLRVRSAVPEQRRSHQIPLVGRDAELAELEGALAAVIATGSVKLVTLIGAPGIGKSRLTEALHDHVRSLTGVDWLRGRSLAYGDGIAFWALGEMVKAQAGILESDDGEAARTKLRAAVAALVANSDEAAQLTRQLAPLVGLATAEAAAEADVAMVAGWRRTFELMAMRRPTVLVFEDLHWADDALLDFVEGLVRGGRDVPLLVVATARLELLSRRPRWGEGVDGLRLTVPPLSATETARLIGRLLGQAALPADTQALFLERAGGNPLYAYELLRMLRDRGALVQDGRRWSLVRPITAMPETVQDVIAARLDTLDLEERAFMQDAAVVGRVAWLGAVCTIGGHAVGDGERLAVSLEGKQLLHRAHRSSVAGEVELVFSHALVRDVAHRQIPRRERAAKHERAAAWITDAVGEREDKAQLVAHHYTTAFRLRRDAGDDVSELLPLTREALAAAGQQALSVYANAAALRHFEAARELLSDDDPLQGDVLLGAARARKRADQPDGAVYARALDVLAGSERWLEAAEAAHMLARFAMDDARDGEEADRYFEMASDYAKRVPFTVLAGDIECNRAWRRLLRGATEDALAIVEAAMRRAVQDGADAVATAPLYLARGIVRTNVGPVEDGLEDMRVAAATEAAAGAAGTASSYGNLADSLYGLGFIDEAEAALVEGAAWARRHGQEHWLEVVRDAATRVAYHAGRWAEIETEPRPLRFMTLVWWVVQGQITLVRGDVAAARRTAVSVERFLLESGNELAPLAAIALRARAAAELADRAGVRDACEAFFRTSRKLGSVAGFGGELADIAWVASDAELAWAIATLPDASRWKDPIAAVAGRRYADAARLYGLMGSRPNEAEAHIAAAAKARARRDTTSAGRHAALAAAFFHDVDASFSATRAYAAATGESHPGDLAPTRPAAPG